MAVDVEFLNGNNVNNINNNFQRVKNALQEVVGRNGNLPNHMNADLDMNSNDILNVDRIDLQRIIVDGEEFDLRQMRGWAPVFSAIEYNGTVVMKLIDYVGGQGIKPTQYIGWYVGSTGYVQNINQATGFGSSGITDGDRGDITVSNSGTVWDLNKNFDTVSELLSDESMGYVGSGSPTTVDSGDIVTAQGFRYEVATSDAVDAHIETAGGVKLRIQPNNGGLSAIAWGCRRYEDDPDFDNSDVFDHIRNYVLSGNGDGSERVIIFPIGRFNHSRTFKVDWGNAALIGHESLSGSISYAPQKAVGTHLCYTGGGIGVDIGREPGQGFLYHTTVRGIEFGGAGSSVRPQTVMRMRGCSEYYFRDVNWTSGNVLLELVGCGIGTVDTYVMADSNEAHILISNPAGYEPFLGLTDTWFNKGNHWAGQNAMLKIAGRCQSISFVDSWWERSGTMIEVAPEVDATTAMSCLFFCRVKFQQDTTYGGAARNGWFLKATASQMFPSRATLLEAWVFEDCQVFGSAMTGIALQYNLGANTSPLSRILNMTFRGGLFGGGAYTIFSSSTSASGIFVYGTAKSETQTWKDGVIRVNRIEHAHGHFVFDGSALALPREAPPNLATDGQVRWSTTTQDVRVVKGGSEIPLAFRAAGQPDSVAADAVALRNDFNALLAKLRAAGVILG